MGRALDGELRAASLFTVAIDGSSASPNHGLVLPSRGMWGALPSAIEFDWQCVSA